MADSQKQMQEASEQYQKLQTGEIPLLFATLHRFPEMANISI